MVNKKKEFKQLEPSEIVSRVEGFLESQRLSPESSYFILKQCLENTWDSIRIDESEDLEDFYDDEDYAQDVEDAPELVDDLDEDLNLDDLPSLDSDDDFEDVDELLKATDEEKTVEAIKKAKPSKRGK